MRACRLYVENEFIAAGLKALANFTFNVTMPYLNFVEKSSQSDLVAMLPRLHQDLNEGKLDTMKDHMINWTHIKITTTANPLSELDSYILNQMCLKASKGVNLQCAREYWDDGDNNTIRATQLHKLNEQQLNNLPTNNLVSERYLGAFGYLPSL